MTRQELLKLFSQNALHFVDVYSELKELHKRHLEEYPDMHIAEPPHEALRGDECLRNVWNFFNGSAMIEANMQLMVKDVQRAKELLQFASDAEKL